MKSIANLAILINKDKMVLKYDISGLIIANK
jgi:hypothetical protein